MKKVGGVLLFLYLGLSAWGVNGPGWFEGKGERVPFGQCPSDVPPSKSLPSKDSGGPARLSAPDEQTPEIQELARNLQYDPVLMFEFVRNKIEYVPYYGFLKGANQTLLDRAGNDADQAALLAALLRAGGFTAQYNYGYQYIPTMAAHDYTAARWFDVEDNSTAVDRTLYHNGIPGTAYSDWTIVDRIWVEATVSGAVYQLDAAFKSHTRPAGIDLSSAMGYHRSTLLAAAGGEVGANYVRTLSETTLAQTLTALSSNLVRNFRANYPHAEIEDILGESEIIPVEYAGLPASLPFYTVATTNWTTPPMNLIHTVRFQHGGIDRTCGISEIAGKRLSITYTNDLTGSGPLSMQATTKQTAFEPARTLQGFTPSSTPLPFIQQTGNPLPSSVRSPLTPLEDANEGIDLVLPGNPVSGQVVEVTVPAVGFMKRAQGDTPQPMGTYSFDFSYVYNYSPYNIADADVAGYSNPNPAPLHVHTWLINNNSGAYSIIAYSGYFDRAQGQSFTVRIRFNGLGQSYGAKTASIADSGLVHDGERD